MSKTTVVSFLLDETGSMDSIADDTIGGFNSYVKELREDDNQYEFSLVKFDSNRHDKVCLGVPMEKVPELSRDTYRPGAMTPLIDAAMKLIVATEQIVAKRDVNVLVVIQTDGQENCSTLYSPTDLAAKVKDLTEKGWSFVYLGAGIDAFKDAAAYGISAGATMSYSRAASSQTFDSMAANTRAFASTGMSSANNFTPKQRSDAGDVYHGTTVSAGKAAYRQQRADRKNTSQNSSMVDDIDLTE